MDYYDCHDWDECGYPGEFVYGDYAYVDEYYMDERWKPIPVCRHYWISNKARVFNTKTKQFLKPKTMDKKGHLGVVICINGQKYYKYLHRLVAESFMKNPNNSPEVRHLYDNPEYNEPEDLAWGSHQDNMDDMWRNGHGYEFSRFDREKSYQQSRTPVIATNLKTKNEVYFEGQGSAGRELNISQANIWKVLNKERRSAGGYSFRYVDVRGCENE